MHNICCLAEEPPSPAQTYTLSRCRRRRRRLPSDGGEQLAGGRGGDRGVFVRRGRRGHALPLPRLHPQGAREIRTIGLFTLLVAISLPPRRLDTPTCVRLAASASTPSWRRCSRVRTVRVGVESIL